MTYTFETRSPMVSLSDFTKKHGLEMVVTERPLGDFARNRSLPRYYANFRNVDLKQNCTLYGFYGNGNTPEEAIREYAKGILGEWLIVNAAGPDRREILAPNEWLSEY